MTQIQGNEICTHRMKQQHMFHVDTGKYGIGCVIDDKGRLAIDSVSTVCRPYVTLSDHEIALRILEACPGNTITVIWPSIFLKDVTNIICQYKAAVRLIEKAVLNPHTTYGRKRLEKEFLELVI